MTEPTSKKISWQLIVLVLSLAFNLVVGSTYLTIQAKVDHIDQLRIEVAVLKKDSEQMNRKLDKLLDIHTAGAAELRGAIR